MSSGSAGALEPVPRTATGTGHDGQRISRPLDDWRECSAYVLLAEPGTGKTRAFEMLGCLEGCRQTTARSFLIPEVHSIEPGITLFIDALDVVRAGGASPQDTMDAIVRRLQAAGRPRFRLACREAEWLASDHRALTSASPDGKLTVLSLDPLSDDAINLLLQQQGADDPLQFRRAVAEVGLTGLLGNPLHLKMLVAATRGGRDMPSSLAALFERACRNLLEEHDPEIIERQEAQPIADLLLQAGRLCSTLLLSQSDAMALPGRRSEMDHFTASRRVEISNLPPRWHRPVVLAVLRSRAFIGSAAHREPIHRSVASYLAASSLAHDIDHDGLPVSRVMAWMRSPGGIVEPLRELGAWLSTLSEKARMLLIDQDPLGCLHYADVEGYPLADKRALLQSLKRQAGSFAGFRYAGRPWSEVTPGRRMAPLGRAELVTDLRAALIDPERSDGHEAFLDCVLDAIRHGTGMAPLLSRLADTFHDRSHSEDTRVAALEAWLAHAGPNLASATIWLDELAAGELDDPSDRQLGLLLRSLFPDHLTPVQVTALLRPAKAQFLIGNWERFWRDDILALAKPEQIPLLADGLAQRVLDDKTLDHNRLRHDHAFKGYVQKLVPAALHAAGNEVEASRLVRWLRLLMDRHDHSVFQPRGEGNAVREWLECNPAAMWHAYRHCIEQAASEPQDKRRRQRWRAEALLQGATRPSDWCWRQLELASQLGDAEFAEVCLMSAWSATLPPATLPISDRRRLRAWVAATAGRWPQARDWLRSFSNHRRARRNEQRARNAEQATRDAAELRQRSIAFAEPLAQLRHGELANHGLLGDFSAIARRRVSGAEGTDPASRLHNYFGNPEDARLAVTAIHSSIWRSDLPDVESIIDAHRRGEPLPIADACRLAADWLTQDDPMAIVDWPVDRLQRLLAFEFSAHRERPPWLAALIAHRPDLVADSLLRFTLAVLADEPVSMPSLAHDLARDDTCAELARRCVPQLIAAYPTRVRPTQALWFAGTLLNAALKYMPPDELAAIANERRKRSAIDSTQWMAWTLLAARRAPRLRVHDLGLCVRHSRPRMLRLAELLDVRHSGLHLDLPDAAWSRLVALLAPKANPDRPIGAGRVGPDERRRDTIISMIGALESSTDEGAETELMRLAALPELAAWRRHLDHALHNHRRLLRTTRHVYPTAPEVAAALAGGPPSGPQDLAALVCHQLTDLQAELRGFEGTRWQVFWRQADDGTWRPQVENTCRDRLMEMLQTALAQRSVLIRPEDQHANATRADLGLWCWLEGKGQSFRVPIEAKREDHRDVWSAWSDQLEGYAADPRAQGIGIYLVFWFGVSQKTNPKTGTKPTSADDMRRMLVDAIPAEDRHRLSVFVLDLSPPTPVTTRARGRKRQRA